MWIGKFDGTLQCGMGQEVPLPEMAEEVAAIAGRPTTAEKRQWPGFVIQVCGFPTGACNAFEIDDKAWMDHAAALNSKGYFPWPDSGNVASFNTPFASPEEPARDGGSASSSPRPFGEWSPFPLGPSRDWVPFPFRPFGDWLPWPFGATRTAMSMLGHAAVGHDLIGHVCRLYRTGDMLTKDYRRDRVNIEIGPNGRIVAVWFG